MNNKKRIIPIASKHIEAGIKKYDGKPDTQLNILIHNAGFSYTSFVFNDGRILLVLPDKIAAFLYVDQEALFEALDLAR